MIRRHGREVTQTQFGTVSSCTLLGWLLVLALLTVGHPASGVAQITYAIFPAAPSHIVAAQPTSRGTGPHVTLVVRDSTVNYVVNELTRQAHLQLLDDNSNPLFGKRLSVHLVDIGVMEALSVALQGTGLVATMAPDQGTIIVRPQRGARGAQERTRLAEGNIAGRVTDSASGAGLSGASIHVMGVKDVSAVTSDSGNFTLRKVPAGDQVLLVKLFGYRPVERTVTVVDSQRTMVHIVMVSVPTVLSGVVTTATGSQRKIEVGNDITSLNVDSIMHVAPVMSVTDLLETRVPGLTVMHSSGEPGAPSRLRLRGVGSISGNNDPVIIIDGIRVYSNQSDVRSANLAPVNSNASASITSRNDDQAVQQFAAPSPLDQIDPSSIETIEVFKGPSASALYGSDAANGVIVITTKHGRAGPTHWTVDLGQGVNWIPGDWPTNYFRFGTNLQGQGPVCNWYDPTCLAIDSVRTFQALNDPQYTVLSHGSDQTASLTITGGVPTLQYSLTGNSAGTAGNLKLPIVEQQRYEAAYGPIPSWMVRPDHLTTWGVSGSLTAVPSPALSVTLQSSVYTGAQQTSALQGALPQIEGDYISNGYVTTYNGISLPLTQTPLVDNYVERVTDDQVTSQNTVSLSWRPQAWLPITATGGMQTIQKTDKTYIPYGITPSGTSGCSVSCEADTTGYYGLGRGLSHNQTVQAGTTIPLFRQRISLALGGNSSSETTNDFQAYTDQLAPGVSTPTALYTLCEQGELVQCSTATQNSSSSSTYGWYVEPRLNISSRFFAAPGFRLDGGSGGTHATSSAGGAVGGLSAFPKLDLSYVAVDRQSSRPLWGVLTLLRPRVAFGLAGTQPSPQDRLRLFNEGNVANEDPAFNPGGEGSLINISIENCTVLPVNGTNVPGVCLSSLGNTQLRPERSSELEGGFDVTLWNGRLALNYTKYNKTHKDAIIDIPVAPSLSDGDGNAFTIAENIGEVRNTGTELTVNTTLLESRALSWNVGAILSNDNNLLVHLNTGHAPNRELGLVPGYPLFGQWVQPIVSFTDRDHDGIIEPNEVVLGDSLVFAGQPNAKYQLNITTDLHFLGGRLGVHGSFAYQNGLTQTNQAALSSASFQLVGNNPGTPLAYQAAVVAAGAGGAGAGNEGKTYYGLIQTVNTFRFQDLSINYELPRSVSSWFHVPRAAIALQGSNLGLHTNYRGQDPDVNAFSTVSSVDETADTGQIPEPRTWWFKLTLGN